MTIASRVGCWRERLQRLRRPLPASAWRGAGAALRLVGWIFVIAVPFDLAVRHFAWQRALGLAAIVAIPVLAALVALLLIRVVRTGPLRFWWGALLTILGIAAAYGIVLSPKGLIAMIACVLVGASLLGAGVATWREHGPTWKRGLASGIGGGVLAAVAIAVLLPGWPQPPRPPRAPQHVEPLDLPDPGARGPFAVKTLTYGSGADRHRPEFAGAAAIKTTAVDGAHLIDGWSGFAGWLRTRYWGFDATALPRQGRVWYPDGAGPFPLVLMVHGNHDMEDFSDGGYAYLGELFASRGIIAVSVDENFLNSGYSDIFGGIPGGLDKENDARGWMLLEHLVLWREWNADENNPFRGRVDLDRIMLIGHSRGGEAAAIAALFNRLPYFPDDSRVAFDFDFAVRGVIAIAPSDGQYEPRGLPTDLRDVSFLVLQGSQDGDVQSFMGSSQYSRVSFDACDTCFKAGVYLLDANHGQFNTSWGRNDLGPGWGVVLNEVPIMDPLAQRRVASALFGAFAAVVLQDDVRYRPFLAQPDRGRAWLGDVALVGEYADADDTVLADYEEDDDLTTGSLPDVTISATELTRWCEKLVSLKWKDLDSAAALVGWKRADDRPPPEYRLDIADNDHPASILSFDLAMDTDSPIDDDPGWKTPDTIDLHVVVADRTGHEAAIALSELQPLYPPVDALTRKFALLDAVDPSEPVFQTYRIPLERFAGVDAGDIASIRFRFDVTPAGSMYIDNIALGTR